MKHFVSASLLGLLLAIPAHAQSPVDVDVTLDRDQFIPDEPVIIGVRISNHSGRTLHLGNRPDWLSVTIESRDKRFTTQSGSVPEAGAVELANGGDANRKVDIAPLVKLSRPGNYQVSVRVRINEDEWKEDLTGEPKPLEVIIANRIFEKEFGVPLAPGQPAGGAPEIRKYIVQQARFKNAVQLYLRLTDGTESQVYLVDAIAPTLTTTAPDIQLDKESNLHVLNQIGRVSYGYSTFSPAGQLIGREVHEYADGKRPRLRFSREGDLAVVGGVRRPSADDIPPYEPPKPEVIDVRKPEAIDVRKPAP